MHTSNRRSLLAACLIGAISAAVLLGASACSPPESSQNQSAGSVQQQAPPAGWKEVEQALGRKGTMMPGDVYRFSMPRSDLRVVAKGVEIKPALALGSWAAFKIMGDGKAMVMGDLVMTEDEISPVMLRLQQGGVEQSALHHHILYETPRVLYMHLSSMGDPVKIAETIRAALALTKTPPAPAARPTTGNDAESGGPRAAQSSTPQSQPPQQADNIDLDTQQIEAIIGQKGKVNSGVFQLSVPRAHKITEGGMEIPPSMGVATAINFQPTGDGRAAITGDFVMTANEVNEVIRALRESDVEVTSLHNHALNDEPRMFYMHFWAVDTAVKLARGLRAGLDRTNSVKAQMK